jgi:hypothetical protein
LSYKRISVPLIVRSCWVRYLCTKATGDTNGIEQPQLRAPTLGKVRCLTSSPELGERLSGLVLTPLLGVETMRVGSLKLPARVGSLLDTRARRAAGNRRRPTVRKWPSDLYLARQ